MDVSTIMWMITLIFSFSPLIHCQTGEIFFISQTEALYYMIRDTSFIFTQPNPTVSYEAAALNRYNIIDTTHGNSRNRQTNATAHTPDFPIRYICQRIPPYPYVLVIY